MSLGGTLTDRVPGAGGRLGTWTMAHNSDQQRQRWDLIAWCPVTQGMSHLVKCASGRGGHIHRHNGIKT